VGPVGFGVEQQELIWAMWRRGDPIREMERALGETLPRIRRYLRESGGIPPIPRKRRVGHLTLVEREEISRGIAAGLSARAIAGRIDRPSSTVSREIARNGGRDAYRALVADAGPPLLVSMDGAGATGFEDFIAGGDCDEPASKVLVAHPDDIACLLFTSGTTGASKCCVLGQRELRRVAFTMNAEMRSGSADRGLINMPMFHFGAMGIIGGLHARGGTVVLQKQFDAAEAVRLIAEERITVLHLAPVMLRTLLDEVCDDCTLESVRTVVYSAAPMTLSTLRRALAMMPEAGFLNLYGQTEAIVSGLPRELHGLDGPDADAALRSVGFPFPGVQVRIVGADGRDVPVGDPGEIVVRSDSYFRGYWDDQAATLTTLRDGWCHTGDIGRLDDRGLLYLVDRKKDVIISGGENVYSPEVEDAVSGLDDVAACAVVGTPDERWGEAVCAVVVPRNGATLALNEVQDFVRRRLARYKIPRRLVIVDELPVLASGKVDKKRLRAELAGD